jgi:hypothetical protein
MPAEKKPILLRNGNPQGNPMNAPRCGAQTRQGIPCRAPAMANGRCRMHGGKSTGPRTAAGLARSRQARYQHGRYSAQAKATCQSIRALETQCEALLEQMSGQDGAEGDPQISGYPLDPAE